MSLDGREGVASEGPVHVEADRACLLSERGDALLRPELTVTGGHLTIEAAGAAGVPKRSELTLTGELAVRSNGDTANSNAGIGGHAVVTAGSIWLDAPLQVRIGSDAMVSAPGAVSQM